MKSPKHQRSRQLRYNLCLKVCCLFFWVPLPYVCDPAPSELVTNLHHIAHPGPSSHDRKEVPSDSFAGLLPFSLIRSPRCEHDSEPNESSANLLRSSCTRTRHRLGPGQSGLLSAHFQVHFLIIPYITFHVGIHGWSSMPLATVHLLGSSSVLHFSRLIILAS